MSAISGRMMRGSGRSPARSFSRTVVPLTVTGFSSGCASTYSLSGTGADPSAQLQALQTALRKAIELGPQVEELSAAAVASIGQRDLESALPDQQQAGQLLREIAKSMAQQPQPPDSSPGEDGSQEDQNQQAQQRQPDEQQAGQSPQDRALSVLRRARERERQHRDLQRQLQQRIGGQVPVDRDW